MVNFMNYQNITCNLVFLCSSSRRILHRDSSCHYLLIFLQYVCCDLESSANLMDSQTDSTQKKIHSWFSKDARQTSVLGKWKLHAE